MLVADEDDSSAWMLDTFEHNHVSFGDIATILQTVPTFIGPRKAQHDARVLC